MNKNKENLEKLIDQNRKQKIEALDNKYYYNYNLNKLSLKLYYVNSNENL